MSDTPTFNIEKIYVKDLSLEIPNAPTIFLDRETPQIEVGLETESAKFDDGIFEVVLRVTVSAKIGDKMMFLIETKQAGIFQINNIPSEELGPIFGVVCPNILFPYVRETISDIITRAGFPPVLLAPVNFEALYQQHLKNNESRIVVTH